MLRNIVNPDARILWMRQLSTNSLLENIVVVFMADKVGEVD